MSSFRIIYRYLNIHFLTPISDFDCFLTKNFRKQQSDQSIQGFYPWSSCNVDCVVLVSEEGMMVVETSTFPSILLYCISNRILSISMQNNKFNEWIQYG